MNLKKSEITVNKNEILKTLGYDLNLKSIDEITDKEIDKGISYLLNSIQINYQVRIYRDFGLFDNHLIIKPSDMIIKSQDLSDTLIGADKLAIMSVTIGSQIEKIIKKSFLFNPDRGLIYDAIASHLIESAANSICKKLCIDTGLFRKPRFSPGYGDLDLSLQSAIIELLGGYKKTGIEVNKSHQMIPSKSITAFIGLFKERQNQYKNCNKCSIQDNCRYLEEGVYCYDQQNQE